MTLLLLGTWSGDFSDENLLEGLLLGDSFSEDLSSLLGMCSPGLLLVVEVALEEAKMSYYKYLNLFTLRFPLESIICYFRTFENNLGIEQTFTKYLMESCCLTSGQHSSFKYFLKNGFVRKNISKIVRPVLAGLSVNGLKQSLKPTFP